MTRTFSKSDNAQSALTIVSKLQRRLAGGLESLSKSKFSATEWLREQGDLGGGVRLAANEDTIFNRASVNVSQVQYESLPEKKLNSATAISTIVHFNNPHVPSLHLHVSWTEFKDGQSFWRLMADLNPSIPYSEDKVKFIDYLKSCTDRFFNEGIEQGEQYFYIPTLKRCRGVAHFYLEEFSLDKGSEEFAQTFGETMIDTYLEICSNALNKRTEVLKSHLEEQLQYHTLYLFQVLTLDRGTTAGILVHNQNDVGTLGSIPKFIDLDLLKQWSKNLIHPEQKPLLEGIVGCFSGESPALVDDQTKEKLCEALRAFYSENKAAGQFLAKGTIVPKTIQNHRVSEQRS